MQEQSDGRATDKAKELVQKIKDKVLEQVNVLKTKEGRDAFVAKAKATATTAKDKTISLWESGPKGKVILCVAAMVVLWLIWPSNSGKANMKGSSGGKTAKIELKKIRDTKDLFFEGTLPEGVEWEQPCKEGDYVSVVPNLIIIPPSISYENLCGMFNPEMEDIRKEGVSYLNNPQSIYYATVAHVGRGYVIAKPDSSSMYGHYYGYIYTDDKYVEGARLKFGFYTYLGTRKTVPLTNGSTHTMYAFRKLDDKIAQKISEAAEYNVKAREAAEMENLRRQEVWKKDKEKEDKKFEENSEAAIDEAFRKALAAYDSNEWKTHVHIASALKGKIKISDVAPWWWIGCGESGEITFSEFKKKLETEGGAKYWEQNGTMPSMFSAQSLKDLVLEKINSIFKCRRYQLRVDGAKYEADFFCYKIDFYDGGGYSIRSENPASESGMTFQVHESVSSESTTHFYIIDSKKDTDIKALYDRTGNSEETAKRLIKLFEKKYGK